MTETESELTDVQGTGGDDLVNVHLVDSSFTVATALRHNTQQRFLSFVLVDTRDYAVHTSYTLFHGPRLSRYEA